MAKTNGNLWFKVIGIVIILLGAAVTYGLLAGNVEHNTEDIAEIKPEVKKNTEARIDVEWIKGSLKRIEEKI